jgi:hypothetical protein
MITMARDVVQVVLWLVDTNCRHSCEKRRSGALLLPECPRDNAPSTLTIEDLGLQDAHLSSNTN